MFDQIKSRITIIVLLILSCIMTATLLQAATITWHGSADNDWNNGANWSTGTVPADGDDIIIDRLGGNSYDPVIIDLHPVNGATYKANSIFITSGDKLTVSKTRNLLIQHIGNSSGIRVEGELVSYGGLEISDAFHNGIQIVAGGTADIYGSTIILDCGRNGIFVEGRLFIGKNDIDPLANAPTVRIYQIADDGIFINSSGVVEIDDAIVKIGVGLFDDLDTPNVEHGIYNKNLFDLIAGTIQLGNAFDSGYTAEEAETNLRTGTFTVGDIGQKGISSLGGDFTVFPLMEVDIFNTSNRGYDIREGCNFVHNGTSSLGINGAISGNGLWVGGENTELTNNGTLNIGNCGLDGIILIDTSLFINNGIANVGQNTGTCRVGIIMQDSGTFINDGGTINVDEVVLGAVYHSNQIEQTVTSYNRNGGVINLHLNSPQVYSTGCITLFDLSKFVNEECSKIVIGETTNINDPNDFTNLGTIVDFSAENSSIHENSGTIYNLNGGAFNYTNGVGAQVLTVLDISWDPCIDNQWDNAGNWSSFLPKADSDVIIPQTSNDPIVTTEQTIKSLRVENNATLTVNNTLNIEESDSNGLIIDGVVIVNDRLAVSDATESGAVINGDINVETGGTLTLNNNGKCQLLNNDSGKVEINTSGAILMFASENVDSFCLLNNGRIENNNGQLLMVTQENNEATHVINNDTLINHGSFLLSATNAKFDILLGNNGYILNDSTFNISTTTDNSNIGLFNNGDFFNQGGEGDTLKINNNNSLFQLGGTFENSGNIYSEDDIIVSSDTLINTIPGRIFTDKSIIINTDGVIENWGFITIKKDFTNNDGVLNSPGFLPLVDFVGSETSNINGFDHIRFIRANKDNPNVSVALTSDISVNGIFLDHGNLDLNGYILDISNGVIFFESDTSYITSSETTSLNSGYVLYDGLVQTILGYDPGNIGVEIRNDQHLGNFEIRRYPSTYHDVTGETRLTRFYTLTPESVTEVLDDVEITVKYLDHELNGASESNLSPYIINTGESPEPISEHALVSLNTTANEIVYNRLYLQNTILPASSGGVRDMQWTGAENTDWHNPDNWSITGPPSNLYSVSIPNVVNHPIVNSPVTIPATCKTITLETGVHMTVKSPFIIGDVPIGMQTLLDAGVTPLNLLNGGASISDFIGLNYAGGIIFYMDPTADGTGLVSASLNQSPGTAWGCYGTPIPDADGTAIGTGNQNTIAIEAGCTNNGIAADICANLDLNGFTDWFLPSKDELAEMYTKIGQGAAAPNTNIGNFEGSFYWSSTEANDTEASILNFGNGNTFNGTKDFNTVRVRAIRAF